MAICDRCAGETVCTTGSYFNLEIICTECDDRESAHPRYEEARRIEAAEVARGNYNFPGVGLPQELID